ncbi:MAG TPA: amidohydrolase [Vicinamibacterales bacterium]|nr:amidohydrolase [Vicinamibacterales bacterium]
MKKISRKQFFGFGAALAGVGLAKSPEGQGFGPGTSALLASQPSLGDAEPDFLVVNARVYTVDPAQPRAEAFAVKNGRFIAVGSTADVRNLATARTRVIDAAQATVTPGFIDTHCHVSGVNELYAVNANVRRGRELLANLRAKADKTPAGMWVSAVMFDDTKLDVPLTRQHLDEVSKDHPIVVGHRGGHTSWYNSKAFELAGVTKNTPDPDHGRFFRDDSGELNGRVAEQARAVFAKVGVRETFTPAEQRERGRAGMRHISELLTAAGLTSVHDAGADRDRILAYEDAKANGELRHRACFLVRGNATFSGFKAAGITYGFGDEWLRVGGVKYGADGSASERTMRMSTPFVGTNDYGILTMTQQEIDDAVDDAHRHDFRVAIHANGDVTIDMVLKAYEKVLAKYPRPDTRHRIEHCSLVNPDLLRRIKAIGAIPTPFWTYVYYHGEKWKEYGPDRMEWMFAHKSFLDGGIPVPGASDYGPGPFEPLMAIQSMVTRTDYNGNVWGPKQKVTVDEALRIGTINGAYASHEEGVKGSISAGKYADFVMLEQDPHDVNASTIKDIKIVRTVVGGKTMHPKNES